MITNLLDLSAEDYATLVAELGEKPFRARQLKHWIHQAGCDDLDAMTDLSKRVRERLKTCAQIKAPRVLSATKSDDGTRKWLLDVGAQNAIETVFIPENEASGDDDLGSAASQPRRYRGTLCISSQAGCALACTFCSTGRQGFNRNLTLAEIIGQLWLANRTLVRDSTLNRPITNVVMMGMGEPLANFDNVVAAMRLMLDDGAYGLSRRRVTLSTSGLVPAIDRLREACPVALAVSLHAPNDELRDHLVPINKKYPLSRLLRSCATYIDKAPRNFVTFEYVMLSGVNDTLAHARELATLLQTVPCKINLIPFNDFPRSGYQSSSDNAIAAFRDILMRGGYTVTVRKTRGDDIDAACGQLAGQVQDKTRRRERRVATIS